MKCFRGLAFCLEHVCILFSKKHSNRIAHFAEQHTDQICYAIYLQNYRHNILFRSLLEDPDFQLLIETKLVMNMMDLTLKL